VISNNKLGPAGSSGSGVSVSSGSGVGSRVWVGSGGEAVSGADAGVSLPQALRRIAPSISRIEAVLMFTPISYKVTRIIGEEIGFHIRLMRGIHPLIGVAQPHLILVFQYCKS